jgi:hypothetical protein
MVNRLMSAGFTALCLAVTAAWWTLLAKGVALLIAG